jgi:proline iminopeptidase
MMEARAPINSTDIYYVREGAGRAVFAVHAVGFDHTYLRPWLDPLADSVQLIFSDLRGHGRSARVGFEHVEHATFVSDIDSLREFFGHDRVTLIGHAYGGCLALEYALKHPDCIDGLVLCAAASSAGAAAAEGAPPNDTRDDDAFKHSFMSALPRYFRSFNPDVAMRVGGGMRFTAAAAAHAAASMLPRYDVSARLGEIKVPTLVLAGAHDAVTPRAAADALVAGIAGAELVVFEESGHFPFIEEQPRFLEVVRAFLNKLDAATPAPAPTEPTEPTEPAA